MLKKTSEKYNFRLILFSGLNIRFSTFFSILEKSVLFPTENSIFYIFIYSTVYKIKIIIIIS
jgi:hypothetical protein